MAGSKILSEVDEELHALLVEEKERQKCSLNLIASENFISTACQELLGSCLTNKYSEGYPGCRYYGGLQVVDKIENLCMQRALHAFKLDKNIWHVNVQPLSGSPANLAVMVALLQPHDRIMGLGLTDGGHITHGAYTPQKRLSATSIFFESLPYGIDPITGYIDYEGMHALALKYRPKILICGHSSYPRLIDYKRFRQTATEVGAILWCDMAHYSGFVASGHMESPFLCCDVVTSTTHKTLGGPRNGIIFINKLTIVDGDKKIDGAVFPGLQGGAHQNNIGALCHQLKHVQSKEFRDYAFQILKNCKAFAEYLIKFDYKLVTGGTDNHIILVDLKNKGITGSKVQSMCDEVNISLNKNTIAGDKSAMSPSGVRVGTAALTSRGLREEDFRRVAELFDEAVNLAVLVQNTSGPQLSKFTEILKTLPAVEELRSRVKLYSKGWYLPGRSDI